jgi:opacity protein-like surface antigen
MLAGAVAAMCVGSAGAAEESGFYVGALAGLTGFHLSDSNYNKSAFTWGLFTGWQFNKNFAAELGYYTPGSISESLGADSVKISTHTIATTLIGSYPFNDKWSVFARLGAAFPKVKATVNIGGESDSASDTSTELLYGGGVGLALNRVQLRLEYQRVESDLMDASLLSLGVVVPLGK